MVKIKKILKKNKQQDIESDQEDQEEEEQEEYSFKPDSEQEHVSSELSDGSGPPLLLKQQDLPDPKSPQKIPQQTPQEPEKVKKKRGRKRKNLLPESGEPTKQKYVKKQDQQYQNENQGQQIQQVQGETLYIDYIFGKQVAQNQEVLYAVKWSDRTPEEFTFESFSNIQQVKPLIYNYERFHSRLIFWNKIYLQIKIFNQVKINPQTLERLGQRSSLQNLPAGSQGRDSNQSQSFDFEIRLKKPVSDQSFKLSSAHVIKASQSSSLNRTSQSFVQISQSSLLLPESQRVKLTQSATRPSDSQIPTNQARPTESQIKTSQRDTIIKTSQTFTQQDTMIKTSLRDTQEEPQNIQNDIIANQQTYDFQNDNILYGNLIDDVPLMIVKHKIAKDKDNPDRETPILYFKVNWLPRDGKPLNPTYYKYQQLEEMCPKLLLRYYQFNAVLYQNDFLDEEARKLAVKQEATKLEYMMYQDQLNQKMEVE